MSRCLYSGLNYTNYQQKLSGISKPSANRFTVRTASERRKTAIALHICQASIFLYCFVIYKDMNAFSVLSNRGIRLIIITFAQINI